MYLTHRHDSAKGKCCRSAQNQSNQRTNEEDHASTCIVPENVSEADVGDYQHLTMQRTGKASVWVQSMVRSIVLRFGRADSF